MLTCHAEEIVASREAAEGFTVNFSDIFAATLRAMDCDGCFNYCPLVIEGNVREQGIILSLL
jgi:hypothetical protein